MVKEKRLKIMLVGNPAGYAKLGLNYDVVYRVDDADVVIFSSTNDIFPNIYGGEIMPYQTYEPEELGEFEDVFVDAVFNSKKMIGVGGGAIFLASKAGSEIADTADSDHTQDHSAWFTDCSLYETVPSNHTQVLFPFSTLEQKEYHIHAYAVTGSKLTVVGINELNIEPEIVEYKNLDALCTTIPYFSLKKGKAEEKIKEIIKNFIYKQ